MRPQNMHYEGKPAWEVPTIHDRILRHSDAHGVAAGASYDDAQQHTEAFGSDYDLPTWDEPDDD